MSRVYSSLPRQLAGRRAGRRYLFSEKINREPRLSDDAAKRSRGDFLGMKGNRRVGAGCFIEILLMTRFADIYDKTVDYENAFYIAGFEWYQARHS